MLSRGDLSLFELPAIAAAHAIGRLEICHFHFPDTSAETLTELRARIADSGVTFFTLLIDFGNIVHSDDAQRNADTEAIDQWIDIAGRAGAERVRIIAGNEPADLGGARLEQSASALRMFARRASDVGVAVVTENWKALLAGPEEVLRLLDLTGDSVGLIADFGNWDGGTKYEGLERILPRASSTHAKIASDPNGRMDWDDFAKCLFVCKKSGFAGPHSLIYDGPLDEWARIDEMRSFIAPYLAQ
jgi:sugar phosphate isomerase/epimerase